MFCTRCGKENAEDSTFCSRCGTKLCEPQPGKKRKLAKIAGILDIVSAGLALVMFLVLAILWAILWYRYDVKGEVGPSWAWLYPFLVLQLVGIVLAMVGGIHALRRSSWGWAIAGGAGAAVTGFLCVVALVLTALARDDFRQPPASGQHA